MVVGEQRTQSKEDLRAYCWVLAREFIDRSIQLNGWLSYQVQLYVRRYKLSLRSSSDEWLMTTLLLTMEAFEQISIRHIRTKAGQTDAFIGCTIRSTSLAAGTQVVDIGFRLSWLESTYQFFYTADYVDRITEPGMPAMKRLIYMTFFPLSLDNSQGSR